MDNEEKNKVEEAAVKYGKFMNSQSYLEWESRQKEKHEYVDGLIVTMAGASPNHNFIQSNIIGSLWSALDRTSCKIVASDLKVFVKARQSYFYPDAMIICQDLIFADIEHHVITNPTIIFEILSPSTEEYDLGKKLFFYMQMDSVKELIFINAVSPEIRKGSRLSDGSWKFETLTGLSACLIIETIGFRIQLENIYKEIVF